jgi:hypothetical protein
LTHLLNNVPALDSIHEVEKKYYADGEDAYMMKKVLAVHDDGSSSKTSGKEGE